jgi:hypothetical protein
VDVNTPDALPTIDALLDPVARCFTPNTARSLVSLRPDPAVPRHMEELGRKAAEGSLTPAERQEYQALIEVGDVISILQLKARLQLASASA